MNARQRSQAIFGHGRSSNRREFTSVNAAITPGLASVLTRDGRRGNKTYERGGIR
jgi:hypothetical protein